MVQILKKGAFGIVSRLQPTQARHSAEIESQDGPCSARVRQMQFRLKQSYE